MFSKSLKEASDSDNIGGRRVKLKRTVYQETPSAFEPHRKRPTTPPDDDLEERRREYHEEISSSSSSSSGSSSSSEEEPEPQPVRSSGHRDHRGSRSNRKVESKKSSSKSTSDRREAERKSEDKDKRETNKARQKRKERQREQVRKLEQKQRERDSTPVVDEPRELETLVTTGGGRPPYHHHQRDKPPEPDLPEPIDMFADDDNPATLFRKRLSPPHPVDSAQSRGRSEGEGMQDLLSLTGGDPLAGGNKNVRFEMAGRPEPVSPGTPSPGNTPLSDEDDDGPASNAPLLPVIETQMKPSPVKPVAAPSPYARVPGFSGVPPPSQNGSGGLILPPEPPDVLPSAASSTQGVPPPTPTAHALPTKELHEMHHISQLLNSQQKLAAPGSSRPRGGDAFKTPAAPLGSGASSLLTDRKHRFDNIDITDMDVASPTSDDELVGSFTPPSFSSDDRDDKKKKRHAERKRKAASAAAASGSSGGGQGKPFPTLNVEALARTIAELTKDDDVPTSAVELDKQRKVSHNVCTTHFRFCFSVRQQQQHSRLRYNQHHKQSSFYCFIPLGSAYNEFGFSETFSFCKF